MADLIQPGAIQNAITHIRKKSTNEEYLNDPVKWAHDVLGVHMWSKQREICESVVNNKRTVVRSANGTGKSFIAGVIAAWWIATQYVRDPLQTIVVITAPSFSQIRTNMFHELNMELHRSQSLQYDNGMYKPADLVQPLPGKISTGGNTAEWRDAGAQLAIGRKPADGEIITTFQGIHRKNVLFIIDEAGGMPPEMFVAAERMTTNENTRILAIGNPDRRGSEFFKLFYGTAKSLWNPIHISSYDTPTFTGEDCPPELLAGMPTKQWVEENIRAWGGPDDPRVQIAINGNFPDSDESIFFPESVINKAEDTDIEPSNEDVKIFGVDLAMYGADESKVYLNHGGKIRCIGSWGNASSRENAQKILDLIKLHEPNYVNIDAGGLGEPIIEKLEELVADDKECPKFKLVRMNGAENAPDLRRWYNKRAWWYDLLKMNMINGTVDIDFSPTTFVPKHALREQMTAINVSFWDRGTKNGALIIENKKDLRKRVGYSPDDIDAITYANYDPRVDIDNNVPKEGTQYQDPEDILDDGLPDYIEMIGEWAWWM